MLNEFLDDLKIDLGEQGAVCYLWNVKNPEQALQTLYLRDVRGVAST